MSGIEVCIERVCVKIPVWLFICYVQTQSISLLWNEFISKMEISIISVCLAGGLN